MASESKKDFNSMLKDSKLYRKEEKMYKTIVKYKYMDDKTTLKIVVPVVVWMIMFFIIFFIFTRGIYWIFPIMVLEFLCCIPILIFGLKVKRNIPYTEKIITFEMKDNLLYANNVPIDSVKFNKKIKSIKLISYKGCGFIEEPYIDGFFIFLKSNINCSNNISCINK